MINENLFKAVETGDAAEVASVLTKEKINATTYYGAKSIIFASEKGYFDILKLLLESGVKIERKSFWSNSYHVAFSSLSRAAHNSRSDIVKLLLEYGANADKKDLREAFIEALMSRNLEITKMLLDAGVNVNFKDEKGITPLMCAVLFPSENQETLVEWLLAAGAHVNVKCKMWVKEGKTEKKVINTALTYAKELGNDKIVDMLNNARKYRKLKKNMKTVELLNDLYKNLNPHEKEQKINPTQIFNEGWMTRILVETSITEKIKINEDIDFSKIKFWTSEALIDSPFIPKKSKKIEKGEGYTHADIILGDFIVDYQEKGKIEVNPDAKILGIIEAKMGSILSSGTSNAKKKYNQASRNICCLAHNAPGECEIFFIVVAPKTKIKKIEEQIELKIIKDQVEKRFEISNISKKQDIIDRISKCTVFAISFEDWIEKIHNPSDKKLLDDFYTLCKKYNRIK